MYSGNQYPRWRNQVKECERVIFLINKAKIEISYQNLLLFIKELHKGLSRKTIEAERFAAMICNFYREGRPTQFWDIEDD